MELCEGRNLSREFEDRLLVDDNNNELGYKELDSSLKAQTGIDREWNYNAFSSIISGVKEFHEHDIVHNNINPDNVVAKKLPSGQTVFKIADFSSSKMLDKRSYGKSHDV